METIRFLHKYIFLALILPGIVFAQVPNGGFETWAGGNPVDWLTNNIPGLITVVTQSGIQHSGSSAVRGEVGIFSQEPYPPLLVSGVDASGFTVDQRYTQLSGYYQFATTGDDHLIVIIIMYKNFSPIGAGEVNLGPTGTYTQFNVPIEYITSDVPDRCLIEISVDDSLADIDAGSAFLVDDLTLSGATSISNEWENSVPGTFFLGQNTPNPFNPATTIEYGLSKSGRISLSIYNQAGQHVTTLFDGIQSAGQHVVRWEPANIASGIYVYRLETENRVLSRKMIFVK